VVLKNWRFFEHISLYFENSTRYGHSYNGRQRIKLVYAIYRILPFSMTFNHP